MSRFRDLNCSERKALRLNPMSGDEFNFGRFRLDLGRRQLSRDGNIVQLGSRAIDILCVLASAKGNMVTKDEIMERVWPGLVVAESNIQVHVSALRKALDQDNEGLSHVVTVPGRGYRFVGQPLPVSAEDDKTARQAGLPIPDRPSPSFPLETSAAIRSRNTLR